MPVMDSSQTKALERMLLTMSDRTDWLVEFDPIRKIVTAHCADYWLTRQPDSESATKYWPNEVIEAEQALREPSSPRAPTRSLGQAVKGFMRSVIAPIFSKPVTEGVQVHACRQCGCQLFVDRTCRGCGAQWQPVSKEVA